MTGCKHTAFAAGARVGHGASAPTAGTAVRL
jgi:hypothetical protein